MAFSCLGLKELWSTRAGGQRHYLFENGLYTFQKLAGVAPVAKKHALGGVRALETGKVGFKEVLDALLPADYCTGWEVGKENHMVKKMFPHFLWVLGLTFLLLAGCSSSRYNEQEGRYSRQQSGVYSERQIPLGRQREGYQAQPPSGYYTGQQMGHGAPQPDQPPPGMAHSPEYYRLYGPGSMQPPDYGYPFPW